MQHLRAAADNNVFDPAALTKASAFSLDLVSNEAELLKQQMLKQAEGPLKEFLESLDLKALNIQTKEELMEYIHNNIDSLGIDANEVEMLRMLSEAGRDTELFKSLLLQNTERSAI